LVFSDKVVVVKRKSHSIQGGDYFRNIEENINTEKPVSQPFEFKGWADIRSIELFNGLKGNTKMRHRSELLNFVFI
jgi:hypothetical protein